MSGLLRRAIIATVVAWSGLAAALPPPTTDFSIAEPGEHLPGGETTHSYRLDSNAFSHPSANMRPARERDFKVGNGLFRRAWVSAPSSTGAADGLGPLYNARSCQLCHLKDGRGHPPVDPQDNAVSMVLQLSVTPRTVTERRLLSEQRQGVIPEPNYGSQLQDFSIQGHAAEGQLRIEYSEIPVELADGTQLSLRRPHYRIAQLRYGPLDANVLMSPRVAPQMIGLGLLEAISRDDLLALADPDDASGDGISGRVSWVWSRELNALAVGRFGWKASVASVDEQSQLAFATDIGISVPLFPASWGDCTVRQGGCRKAPGGGRAGRGELEAGAEVTERVAFYARNLAVPERHAATDAEVLAGKQLFYEVGCTGCHYPKFVTRADSMGAEQASQLIWPYTDLLLHDMGEGLADNRPVAGASGREWRTAPLWGIGRVAQVNGHSFYLHDGRARDLTEAILWHGGEASSQRDAFARLDAGDRQRLLRFLESL